MQLASWASLARGFSVQEQSPPGSGIGSTDTQPEVAQRLPHAPQAGVASSGSPPDYAQVQ